jgi:hypothetical protein
MYAGDFTIAEGESKKLIEQDGAFFKAYLPLAVSALARGDPVAARAAYERMAKVGPQGASLAAIGLADLALYEGRFGDVEPILKDALAVDQKSGDSAGAAIKSLVLAEAYDGQGQKALSVAVTRRTLAASRDETVNVPAAVLLLHTDRLADARSIVTQLSQQLPPEPRAFAKALEGEIARRERRTVDAVEAFKASQKLTDLWLARFWLGITYVEAGHHAEGLAELELCQKRRGEATALFLDDVPTFRYLAPLSYWLARAQQGAGQTESALANYKQFVAARSQATSDPLVADATKRIAMQQ